MIVFNQRLLFVHNPKTAGTSLARYFQQALEPPVFSGGVAELGTYHPHLDAAIDYATHALGLTGEPFEAIVSVVRHPVSREISMYRYFRDVLATSPTLATDLPDSVMREFVQLSLELGIDDFIAELVRRNGDCDIWNSRFYYMSGAGDFPRSSAILRCESLEQDLHRLPRGIVDPGIRLQNLNVSGAAERAEALSQKSLDLIWKSYSWMGRGFGQSGFWPAGLPGYDP